MSYFLGHGLLHKGEPDPREALPAPSTEKAASETTLVLGFSKMIFFKVMISKLQTMK